MTEPNAGSDPTLLRTRAVRDGDEWVINGHKWFSTNASIADFLIVMAVTDPDARPHQRASMFLVPADTPGRRHPARRPDDGAPRAELRQARRPRRDPLRGRARPRRRAARRRRATGFMIAQHRLGPGPHPPLHALARRLAAARSTCSASTRTHRYAFGSVLGDKQTVQNWIADSAAQMQAARLMTLHAAWKMDTQGAVGGAPGDLADQVLRRAGAARRRRPRAPDPRLARLLDRHAARGACTASRAARASTTGPTRSTARPSRAASCAATSRPRAACRASTCRRGARPRSASSRTSSRR